MPDNNQVLAVQFSAYGGPDVLELRPVPPPQPGPGDVLVEVHAASVNPIDWKIRSGMLQKVFPVTFPSITGRDAAGLVIGGEASLAGKRVCFQAPRGAGTWTQRIAVPADSVATIPDALSYAQAAAIPLAGLSAWAGIVQTANVSAGQRVLIHAGAGGVGSMAVQIARHRGAYVLATCSQSNVDFVRSLGAQEAIAYDKVAFENSVRDIDVVFDIMGGEVHKRSYRVLKKGGVLAYLAAAPIEDEGAKYGVEVKMARVQPDRAVLSELVALAVAGKVRPMIEATLPLAEFRKAQELSQRGHARGKTVLMMR